MSKLKVDDTCFICDKDIANDKNVVLLANIKTTRTRCTGVYLGKTQTRVMFKSSNKRKKVAHSACFAKLVAYTDPRLDESLKDLINDK